MNYEKIAPQLGDWALKFKPFIETQDFKDIYKFLKAESYDNKIICPHHSNTFRAFRETSFESLKCIFILQDPYPWVRVGGDQLIYTADGMAMSCSNTMICQPSLEYFYAGMEDDLGYKVARQPDLTYLAKQGVLLLNTSLTTEKDKPSSHQGVWDKFIDYMFEEIISFYTRGLVYVAFGKHAEIMAKTIIPFLHWGFEVEHPAFAARKERPWNHDNIFTKINKILKDCNNDQINWAYGHESKDVAEVPRAPRSGVGGKVRKD